MQGIAALLIIGMLLIVVGEFTRLITMYRYEVATAYALTGLGLFCVVFALMGLL